MEVKKISETSETTIQGIRTVFTRNLNNGTIEAVANVVVHLSIDASGAITNRAPGVMPALAEEIAVAALAINQKTE